MQQGTLFAVRFDLDRLETIGQAVPALEGVAANPALPAARNWPCRRRARSSTCPARPRRPRNPIDWLTRDGKTSVLRATKADWANPRFSPDGQKLALEIFDGKQRDIWVYEWARDTLTQLTFDPGQDRDPGLDARRPAHRVCVRPRQGRHLQSVLGERRRHGRGHAADRQPGRPAALVVASERQVPRLPCHSRRATGNGPDDPADGGRCHARLDARHAHGVSEHAGERSGADVLAGRPLDRVLLK